MIQNLLNLFDLKGEIFDIPFNLKYRKKFDSTDSEEINVVAKTFLASSRYRYDFVFYFDNKETYIDNDSTFRNDTAFDVGYHDSIKDLTLETEIFGKQMISILLPEAFSVKISSLTLVWNIE